MPQWLQSLVRIGQALGAIKNLLGFAAGAWVVLTAITAYVDSVLTPDQRASFLLPTALGLLIPLVGSAAYIVFLRTHVRSLDSKLSASQAHIERQLLQIRITDWKERSTRLVYEVFGQVLSRRDLTNCKISVKI